MQTHDYYVAFLRGINVGGKRIINMEGLRSVIGFENVTTVLNSGNIVFEAPGTNAQDLEKKLENILEAEYHFKVDVIVRPLCDLGELIRANPFKEVYPANLTTRYVSFLKRPSQNKSTIPEPPVTTFSIVSVTSSEVCSTLVVTPKWSTTEAMKFLEQHYGKAITTRNWNTVVKIIGSA
jgi:uncharacterized protein (DUF1697 family)